MQKGKKLVSTIENLKKDKIIVNSRVTIAAYPAVGKTGFIYNDYHPKVSNPNYSRN